MISPELVIEKNTPKAESKLERESLAVPMDSEEFENTPIKAGELFIPEAEFKTLKNLHGQAGLEKLAEFKDKLRYQKLGVIAIEEKLIPLVDLDEPLSMNEMQALVKPEIEQFGFGPEFQGKITELFKEILNRSKNIQATISDCLNQDGEIDSAKLYNKLFHRPPKGELKAEVNNFSIYFRLKEDDDFAYISSTAYKRKRELNDKDRAAAQSTGGLSLSDYPSAKLKGAILVESPSYYEDEVYHKNTKLHEEQHALDFLLKDVEFSNHELGLKKFQMFKRDNAESLADLEAEDVKEFALMFITNNPKIENGIKDEISAYFSDGTFSSEISRQLLKENSIYEYGKLYNLPNPTEADGNFKYKYMKLVENGIMAFSLLLNKGYSYEAAHAVLYPEPIAYWLKSAQRMLGIKIDPKSYLELEKQFIHPEIIEGIDKVKKYELDDAADEKTDEETAEKVLE